MTKKSPVIEEKVPAPSPEPMDFPEEVPDPLSVVKELHKQLSQLAQEQKDAEMEVERLESLVKKAKEKVTDVSQVRIPELMDRLHMKTFETTSGIEVELREIFSVRLSEGVKDTALDWLEENGFGKAILREVVVVFDKSEEKWANKFTRDLAQRKKKVNSQINRSIHAQTLKKIIKEARESGIDVPKDVFGIYDGRVAKISFQAEEA